MSEQGLKSEQEQGDQLEDKKTPEYIARLLEDPEKEDKLRQEIRKLSKPVLECSAAFEVLYNMTTDTEGRIERNEEKAKSARLDAAETLIKLNELLREMGAKELEI